ncbi:MAG: phospho-N-acetylmuramoyl-pentapeptide-transferase [Candidatus Borkfalkiaceae bacterium]|nr:phospho-N-acetylmuramoyl-pentapeptide-transferase [Eubacteriales bacterium]MDY5820031.1 phospho-N-acetylmuramoyl-pentapeptide-transferase [Christensenellaceae bacterium]
MKNYLISFLVAAIVSVAIGAITIPLLKKLKFGQNILSYVSEHDYKSGTPTIGGIIFISSCIIAYYLFRSEENRLSEVCVAVFVAYALVGFIDDFIKIKLHRNEGLNPVQKTLFEIVIAVVVSAYAYTRGLTKVNIPFTNIVVDLKFWYIPLCAFCFIATTNSVNLTDGLDGLAGGVTYVYTLVFGVLLLIQVSKGGIRYPISEEYANVAQFSFCLSGALVGFLFYNTYRAKVFMGDTGSLALGGAVAITAALSGNLLFIPIIGITYVASSISVILQVAYFKLSGGKRIFLMAPLHHHFQHKGYAESKIAFGYKFVTLIIGLTVIIFIL